jgi:nanoRNase/pAp phosphatase (c-di-AMP/oligoRNAs hydrolase)
LPFSGLIMRGAGKKELLRRFEEFCMGLSKRDNIALLHHSDPDGFCSALLAMRAIESIAGTLPRPIAHYEYGGKRKLEAFLGSIGEKKPAKLVVVDIAIDADPHWKKLSAPFDRVLVMDHHKLYNDLGDKKTVFLKAGWFSKIDPAKYACSKFCFDLFGRVADVSVADWIACIGILGDMCLDSWKGFVEKTVRRRKLGLEKMRSLCELIAATEVMAPGRMNSLLLEFHRAKKPKALLESKFKRNVSALRREKNRLVSGFEKKAEHFPELGLSVYETRTSSEGIKSYVVNELSAMHPTETIVLIQDSGKGYLRISARRQDYALKMNELMEKSIAGIPGAMGGGHIPAAAAKIRKRFKSRFKKNLLRAVEKMLAENKEKDH